jgi:hypothetical protein
MAVREHGRVQSRQPSDAKAIAAGLQTMTSSEGLAIKQALDAPPASRMR